MSASRSDCRPAVRSQRPKATTVFAAAFLAGAAAAVGLNRTLDVHLAQRQPRVESEPIFVALRTLPQGAPVTVWDVALREWPKAMLPAAAMRARDSFEGMVLRHPLREGQPILSVQLVKMATADGNEVADSTAATAPPASAVADPPSQQADLWAPAELPEAASTPSESMSQAAPAVIAPETTPEAEPVEPTRTEQQFNSVAVAAEPVVVEPVISEPVVVAAPSSTDIDPVIASVADSSEVLAAPQRETVMRYLVVPERIALEADRSFVPAAPETQPGTVPEATTAQAPPQQPVAAPAQAKAQQSRVPRPADRTSSTHDRQPQRPPRSATGQTAPIKQPENTSFLRSMMPGLSLGMGAVEPEASPVAKPEQPARPTFRGFGLFR